MTRFFVICSFASMLATTSFAQVGVGDVMLSADRIAYDNVTKAAKAEGHVHATCGVVTIRGEKMERGTDGSLLFDSSTYVTTCTNELGHTHWNVTGAVEYKSDEHVILKNCWLTFYEIPIVYLPYFWYPLGTKCGFSWMPGWTSDWGAYLMTKYTYNLIDGTARGEDSYALKGTTRFDIREEQGLAFGQDFNWRLNGFGRGHLKTYFAWDRSDMYDDGGFFDGDYRDANWGNTVPDDRYAIDFGHRWNVTERDTVRVRGALYSDLYFRDDFFRDSFFSIANPYYGFEGNELAWEHLESVWGVGVSVSGPLDDFWGGTVRLPEVYVDVNPMPLGIVPVNYESSTRVGYLGRTAGEMGRYRRPHDPRAYNPGPWADYETFRFDTYHRLTSPFRSAGDVLSIVPRLALRATYWNECGGTDLTGFDEELSGSAGGEIFRVIPEFGVTFASRGTGWLNETWQHMVEPYFDILAQEAFFTGASNGRRPYVFDNLDASVMWEDQFAGRARNLPYSYYGVTPGLRQAWRKLDEKGSLRTVLDFDVYAALQFNRADHVESPDEAGRHEFHRLAEPGSPNYGERDFLFIPGLRVRWTPESDMSLLFNAEYDSENRRLALADVGWKQRLSSDFSFYAKYDVRNYRWWDYSSAPYANDYGKENPYGTRMDNDDFNRCYFHLVEAGFEHHPIDWFRLSPFVRWDLRDGELDCVGGWFDYLLDCIGFRLTVAYKSEYSTVGGYEHGDRFHVGFTVFLRAMGDDGANIFNND